MARRRRMQSGGSDPGFMEGIQNKFSAILGKIQSLSGLSKPAAAAPDKKSDSLSTAQSFAESVANLISKGHLPSWLAQNGSALQSSSPSAPTPNGKVPTPNNPSKDKSSVPTPGGSRDDGQMPSWLKYQISLSQHAVPSGSDGSSPKGPKMPRGYRRGKRFAGKLKSAWGSLTSINPASPTSQTVSSLSGAAKNVGAGLSGLGGAAGVAGGAISAVAAPVAFAAAVFKATEGLQNWTRHLHESNMQFAEFSASMTRVEVESQIRNIMLSRERGERRAESAKYLAEESDTLVRTLAPIEDFAAVVKNRLVGGLSEVAVGFFEMGKKLTGFNALTGEKPGGAGSGRDYVREFMKDLDVEKWHERYGRPSRFNSSGAYFGGKDFGGND